jgi:hypothetical protein
MVVKARARPFRCPYPERDHAESCSDNSSTVRTVELSLTNVFKRFVGRICDLAETRAPRPAGEGQPEAQALGVPEPLVAHRNCHGAKKADDATTEQAAQGAGRVRVLSGRHIKSSKHVLRDGCLCHCARCSSWRCQMDLRHQKPKFAPPATAVRLDSVE